MSERYQRVYTLPSMLYKKGAPVIVLAGALLKDTKNNSIVAQLKFKSVTDKTIKSLKISIQSFDVVGEKIDNEVFHQYLDLNVKRDDEFGQKEAIALPDNTTRQFNVSVIEAIFGDNHSWCATDNKWIQFNKPEQLSAKLHDKELIKQYKIDLGVKSKSV